MEKEVFILGIESSCDDTAAAVCVGTKILSNVIANQKVHQQYGGVVPELASRAHQANVVPVVASALDQAGVDKSQLAAVAYTRGPGLLGSLLVGSCFAKSFAQALAIPSVEVNHLRAHILSHFAIRNENDVCPSFPFLCLTVSGGHTQLVKVDSPSQMTIVGETLDDAAGEAFDKIAKLLSLPYPGGPLIDKMAIGGNPLAYSFNKSNVAEYNYSFSGFKTNVMNFIAKSKQHHPDFVETHLRDICASVQHYIVETLLDKLQNAADDLGIYNIALAGGVAANSLLRQRVSEMAAHHNWKVFIPAFEFCTDNAAMIAVAGFFKFRQNIFSNLSDSATARYSF